MKEYACPKCGSVDIFIEPREQDKMDDKPYSDKDYIDAKTKGLDLDDWNDYVEYYGLGEREEY
jgi:hypothetical protein